MESIEHQIQEKILKPLTGGMNYEYSHSLYTELDNSLYLPLHAQLVEQLQVHIHRNIFVNKK